MRQEPDIEALLHLSLEEILGHTLGQLMDASVVAAMGDAEHEPALAEKVHPRTMVKPRGAEASARACSVCSWYDQRSLLQSEIAITK